MFFRKLKRYGLKIKNMFVGYLRDVDNNLETSESVDDLGENNKKSFIQNVRRSFGNKGVKTVYMAYIIAILTAPFVKDIFNEFTLTKNIYYAITSDEVIEEVIKEKDEEIDILEKENVEITSKYEQLQKNYDALLDSEYTKLRCIKKH